MTEKSDVKDQDESRKIAILLVVLLLLFAFGGYLMLPLLVDIIEIHLSPGLGIKDSAIIAFFISITTLVLFAVVSGDGLIGEVQFLIGGFFLFFTIIWFLLAWIF